MTVVVVSQLLLLAYHQVTTWFDFYPFNGARRYSGKEKWAEAGSNAVLMSLAPIGFIFGLRAFMTFGVVYYFVLFAIELIIWWVPYCVVPAGRGRIVYNRLLAFSIARFEPGDTLEQWTAIYQRLHRGTITLLPARDDRPVPNLEHTILHLGTLVIATLTLLAYRNLSR